MARAVRRAGLIAPAALVAVSTVAYALAGRRVAGLWIMPDEAIYADRALRLWHHGSLPVVRGQGAGYGLLYPALAAAPLALGNLASLKLVQAFVMSLAAAPVFLYGRRVMPPAYALGAAALTVATPLLLYSGLVMTEVLFYPLAALTMVAIACAVETARARDQVIALVLIAAAVTTRTQAVVLVPVLAAAALVDALLARDRSRLRAFWPTWLALIAAVLVAAAAPGAFGSYSSVVGGGYPIGSSLRLTYDHLAYIVLTTAVVPFAALGVLVVDAARRPERDPAARALLAVTVCAVVAVCVQVGFFAARFAPHLLGRDLSALPPLLYLTFALWLARGLPRRPWLVASVSFVVLAVLALAPWDQLIVEKALPDSFGFALVYRWSSSIDAATLVTVGSLALLVVFALVPRRAALVLPLAVLVLLVATSVSASAMIESRSRADQAELIGAPRNWIDQVARGPVTYLYDGEYAWNSVWQQRFWNHRIAHVLSLPPARVPGPIRQVRRAPTPDGRLATSDPYIVAADRFGFTGTPVVHHARGLDLEGLTLWRLTGRPTLAMITTGVLPNGDMIVPGRIVVYGCAGGVLHLTLLPKATKVVTISLDGRVVLRKNIAGRLSWTGAIRVPDNHRGLCHFRIRGGLLLGSTVRTFERASS
ncbi:MAG: glycosyltransferase family 39 protein [Gaiellaceae bacterium]